MERQNSLFGSQLDRAGTFMSQADSELRGTEKTVEQLYGLMDQIEDTVWDNVRLTHTNAKLLEFAQK